MRPAEGGRSVVVRRDADGFVRDVLPPPLSARTRVHEYGGGAFTVADGVVYFASFADQRLYRSRAHEPGSDDATRGGAPAGSRRPSSSAASTRWSGAPAVPEPLTDPDASRYADMIVDRARRRLVCVREDHAGDVSEPVNTLVAVDLDRPGAPRVLVRGADFYAAPRLSPDGRSLAWLSWSHPSMPWDTTDLWVAPLRSDGSLGPAARVAGGGTESVVQPEWSPAGRLHFVSDRDGWWNLYAWHDGRVRPLCPRAAEFARPQWVFGVSSYGFLGPREIVCTYVERGRWMLASLDTETGALRALDLPHGEIASLRALPGRASRAAVFIGAAPDEAPAIVRCDLATGAAATLRRSADLAFDRAWWSRPEPIAFPTCGGGSAHAFLYSPRNPEFATAGRRAASAHRDEPRRADGGRVDRPRPAHSVLDQPRLRRPRRRLPRQHRLRHAPTARRSTAPGASSTSRTASRRRAPRRRAAGPIRRAWRSRGGSAGGYTTLCALTFHDVFHAGASYYGISDLEALARDTHKFEAHYLERLVGPYPARRDLYRARSPIHFADRLSCPVIFFQGRDDRVVPPDQAERMVEALRARGLPVAFLVFAGEAHGFRRAETIERALEAELFFYARAFGVTPADPLPAIAIENAR